jgi:MYXO-CTERM domain-containing protein
MMRKLLWIVPLALTLSVSSIEAKPGHKPPKPPKPTPAPEFDPSAGGAALALLLGGAWVLSERRRREAERD